MKKIMKISGCVGLISGALLLAPVVQADVVYNNTTTTLDTSFDGGASEFGDQIILSSSGGAIITNFTFEYFVTGTDTTENETARVRFYRNDGPTNVTSANFATPGSVLFDSGPFNISEATFTRDGSGIGQINFNDSNDAAFLAWDGLVPGEFTWTIQFTGLDIGETAGLTLYNPPTVGNGYDDYWDNPGTGWELRQDLIAPITPVSFGAQLEGIAVPEPSTLMLGAVGGVLALVLNRRNRRS